MSGKRETVEQGALGLLGGYGIGVGLVDIVNTVQALTVIVSFLFIVIPTGVWATLRAWNAIKKEFGGKK